MAAMETSKLRIGAMMPAFELMSAEGTTINIWDLKALKNIVIAFLPAESCAGCDDFLTATAENYLQYKVETTEFLCVIRGRQDDAIEVKSRLNPPFPILYDETGKVTDRYTDSIPAVFVGDRFGEIYAQWIVGANGSFPTQKEILDVVELINLECPECGARLEWR